jgi:Zn finger protein HypA/HybF involved in hydrogenase expression
MSTLHTDGNEVAGVLEQFLAVEVTQVQRRCQSCGDRQPLAAHRAFHGAGIVLRCPSCGDVAVVVGLQGDHLTLEWRGTYRIQVNGDSRDEPVQH